MIVLVSMLHAVSERPPLELTCITLSNASSNAESPLMTPVWWSPPSVGTAASMQSSVLSANVWWADSSGSQFPSACGLAPRNAPPNSTALSIDIVETSTGGRNTGASDAHEQMRFGALVPMDVSLPRLALGPCFVSQIAIGPANASFPKMSTTNLIMAAAPAVVRAAAPPSNILFNSTSPHASAVFMAEASGAALLHRGLASSTTIPPRVIVSHPLPETAGFTAAASRQAAAQMLVTLLLPLAIAPAGAAASSAAVRASGQSATMTVAGVHPAALPLSMILAHVMTTAVPFAAAVTVGAAWAQIEALAGDPVTCASFYLLLVLYGAATAPFDIFVSRVAGCGSNSGAAAVTAIAANLLTGFVATALTHALAGTWSFETASSTASESIAEAAARRRVRDWFVAIFRCFPPYVAGEGLLRMGALSLGATLPDGSSAPMLRPDGMPSVLSWSVMGQPAVLLISHTIAYAVSCIIGEAGNVRIYGAGWQMRASRYITRLICRESSRAAEPSARIDIEDAGDTTEWRRLQTTLETSHTNGGIVACVGASKRYHRGVTKALEPVWLRVSHGERLAVVGPNGSGKSTLLAVIAGTMVPSSGFVTWCPCMRGSAAGPVIGLCPQGDPLTPQLTGREHLSLMARLRGATGGHVVPLCDAAALAVHLSLADLDITVRLLSGGARRKLSLAVALVATPAIVLDATIVDRAPQTRPFLLLVDEPEAGLDEVSRATLRDTLKCLPPLVALVMTTHSLEMVEAIVDRVVVVSGGALVATVSPYATRPQYN